MKVEMGEKQSIAWFKLAEFVSRGEKERALSLLRLLTHSFHDKAYSKKLAAEILASFDDELAFAEYVQAALLYRAQGDLIEAVWIYEFLTVMQPEAAEYFEKVITLFQELKNTEKILQYQKQLCELLLSKGRVDKGITVFEEMEQQLDAHEKLLFTQKIVLAALTHRYPHQEMVTSYLKKTLEGFLRFSGESELTKFLSSLQALNGIWHKDAVMYLREF